MTSESSNETTLFHPRQTIKVMVVDDHPMIQRGIASLLTATDGFECVALANNGQEALEHCEQLEIDVVLMDMIMPGMDGAQTTLAICSEHPKVRVLILTSFFEDDQVQTAMRAGAMGYLLKSTSANELLIAIRAAHVGQLTLAPEATQALVQATVLVGNGQPLTQREQDILASLSEGLSNQDIANKLVISVATVKFHVTNILMKLSVRSRTEAVLMAIKHKLVSHAPVS
jgi:two-component system, NarL family, response regulator LiaR